MNRMTVRAGTASGGEDVARIGDVARSLGLTLRALRFFEDKGLVAPRRDGTTRLYTPRDIDRLKLVVLGRKAGFPLREIKHLLDLHDGASANPRQLRALIEKCERQIGRLEKQRAGIDEAMAELTAATGEWRAALPARPQAVAATA